MRDILYSLLLFIIPVSAIAQDGGKGTITIDIKTLTLSVGITAVVLTFFGLFGAQLLGSIVRLTIRDELNKAKAEYKALNSAERAVDLWEENLEQAIFLLERALPWITGKELYQAKSNLAWMYAHGGYIEHKEQAIRLAQKASDMSFRYNDRKNNFKINYAYVIMKYSETEESHRKVLKILESIKTNTPNLSKNHLTEVDGYIKECNKEIQNLYLKPVGR